MVFNLQLKWIKFIINNILIRGLIRLKILKFSHYRLLNLNEVLNN